MNYYKTTGKVLFKEIQRFNAGWIYLLILIGPIIPALVILVELTSGRGNFKELIIGLLLIISITAATILFLRPLKLETQLTEEGLFLRWQPYFKNYHFVPWNRIQSVEIQSVWQNSVRGTRYIRKKTYMVTGKKGIQLLMKNKSLLFIGTLKPLTMFDLISEKLATKPFVQNR